jgi:iron-sulfur cluster repair protein YtfE (RIC family)
VPIQPIHSRSGARAKEIQMTAATTARPDTYEMVFVHNCFRRQFHALPGLVLGVQDGDTGRADTVVGFLTELTAMLHHHHSAEDELMWPLLLERAPMDSALILRMEEQHERIAEIYQRAGAQAQVFAASAQARTGQELAQTLTDLAAGLDEHLVDEENHILPLVEDVVTVEEWEALGERGRAGMPKSRQLVYVGFLLQANTPERGREFLAHMPAPVRVLWALVGRRAFARDQRRIYGTDPA